MESILSALHRACPSFFYGTFSYLFFFYTNTLYRGICFTLLAPGRLAPSVRSWRTGRKDSAARLQPDKSHCFLQVWFWRVIIQQSLFLPPPPHARCDVNGRMDKVIRATLHPRSIFPRRANTTAPKSPPLSFHKQANKRTHTQTVQQLDIRSSTEGS